MHSLTVHTHQKHIARCWTLCNTLQFSATIYNTYIAMCWTLTLSNTATIYNTLPHTTQPYNPKKDEALPTKMKSSAWNKNSVSLSRAYNVAVCAAVCAAACVAVRCSGKIGLSLLCALSLLRVCVCSVCVTMCVLQCVAVCCRVLQCVAVCCSVLQCLAAWCRVS